MKIVWFERTFTAHEAVICVHPCVVGRVGATVFGSDRDSRRSWFPERIEHGKPDPRCWMQVPAVFLLCRNLPLRATEHVLNPQRSVSPAIGNKRDVLAIGRPAW